MNVFRTKRPVGPHPSSERRREIFLKLDELFPKGLRLVRNTSCLSPVADYFEAYFPREHAAAALPLSDSAHVYIPRFDIIYKADSAPAKTTAQRIAFSNRSDPRVRLYGKLLLRGWTALCPYFIDGLPPSGCEIILFRCLKAKVKLFNLEENSVKSLWLNPEGEALFRAEARLRECLPDGEVCSPTLAVDAEQHSITERFIPGRHLDVNQLNQTDEAENLVRAFEKLSTLYSQFGLTSRDTGEYLCELFEQIQRGISERDKGPLDRCIHSLQDHIESHGPATVPMATIHGDCNFRNILLDEGGDICLLDFESLQTAHVFHDLYTCLWKLYDDYCSQRMWRRIVNSPPFITAIGRIVSHLEGLSNQNLSQQHLSFFARLERLEKLAWMVCKFRLGLERLSASALLDTLVCASSGQLLPWSEPAIKAFQGRS